MEVLEFIKYLNSKDGPHIPITTLAVYTGTDDAALCRYCNGQIKPKPATLARIRKGVNDLIEEIMREKHKFGI